MVCPKCGSGVTSGASTCGICFYNLEQEAAAAVPTAFKIPTASAAPREEEYAPIPGIPGLDNRPPVDQQPAYPSVGAGGGSGDFRVSLTGEMIEVAVPTPRNMPSSPSARPPGGGPPPVPVGVRPPMGSPPPRPSGPPSRGSSSRTISARPAADEYAGRKSGASALVIGLVVLLLAGGGAGGWWWYNNRTNPKDQAVKVLTALKSQDWKALYPLIAFSASDKAKFPDAETFAKDANEKLGGNPQAKVGLDQVFSTLSDISAGEPTYNGDKAEVPTSSKINVGGMSVSLKGTAHLIKEGGIWKLNSTNGGVQDAMTIIDLVGKPDLGSMGGGLGNMGGGMKMPGLGGM